MTSYLVNIYNNFAPKDNFEIHKLNKDEIYGLIQFMSAINKKFGSVYDIEFLEEYDMSFTREELNEIDISSFAVDSIVIDSISDNLDELNTIYNLYRNYDKVYIHTLIDNTSFLYFFINTSKLSLNIKLDDFIEGIKVGSSFDGGHLKCYTI